MMAKFGLILLVMVFGALMFLVGLAAPDSLRRPWVTPTEHRQLPQIAARTSRLTNQAAQAAGAKTPPDTQPIPYQALLIPSPLPADGSYALQLGSYPSSASAAEWVKRAVDNGWGALQISVLDQNSERWFAVAVGQFNSPDEARAARASLARALGLAQPLPVIRLPPKPDSPGAGPASAKQTPTAPGTDANSAIQTATPAAAGTPSAIQAATPASP